MNLLERVKNILLQPREEWRVIEAEKTTVTEVLVRYALPLSAIGPLALIVGNSLFGARVSILESLIGAVSIFVLQLILLFIIAYIIAALAQVFSGQRNFSQAFKVAVYTSTPTWVAGILNVFPALSPVVVLATLYGIYLLYLGLPVLMKSPLEKAGGYTASVVMCALVVNIALGFIGGLFVGTQLAERARQMDEPATDSALGQLEQFNQKLKASAKKMEEAAQRGDAEGQMAVAVEGLGMFLGGGKRYEPVNSDELKALPPAARRYDPDPGRRRNECDCGLSGCPL